MSRMKIGSIVTQNLAFAILMLMVLFLAFPELCFAGKIDGGKSFDDLLIAILEILEGSVLTATLVFSVVGFGISIALFPHNRETVERAARIVLGLIIAAKGAGVVSSALGLSFLI